MLRYDIINWLIERYGYETYLEIGVADSECFNQVRCGFKCGVDPNPSKWGMIDTIGLSSAIYPYTSDEFFNEQKHPYDIIFIDGDHHEAQVVKDINNSLKHLSDGGTIVVHDCNPPMGNCARSKPYVYVHPDKGEPYPLWNGTVWQAYVKVRMTRDDLQCRCVDADWGCGIIQRGEWFKPPEWLEAGEISYEDFAQERAAYLNLITAREFKEIYGGR